MSTAWLVFVLPASNNTGSEQVSRPSLKSIVRQPCLALVDRAPTKMVALAMFTWH
jgi:hypothetical protein